MTKEIFKMKNDKTFQEQNLCIFKRMKQKIIPERSIDRIHDGVKAEFK